MGYYTYYTVEIYNDDYSLDVEEIKEETKKISGYEYPFEDSCKWYDHERDMKKVSKKFDCVIELSGEGEEAGDLWRKYFYKGKMERCIAEIVYPEPDIKKLMEEKQ